MTNIEQNTPTSEYIRQMDWVVKVIDAIEEACPAGPISPDAPEFGSLIEKGGDAVKMTEDWNNFVEKYSTEDGQLDLKEYTDWDTEIPCPDCNTPIIWSRAIGYNNHIEAECPDCGIIAKQ